MPTINQLTAVNSVASSDQVPIYQAENGDARKASMSVIKTYVMTDPNYINATLTNPLLITPDIGTPTNGNLQNCIGLPVIGGGTGSSTASGARTNLSAAKSGVNTDITSLTLGTSYGVNWSGSTLGVFNGTDKVGFYSGLSGRFWITDTALTYTPNGSDVRFQVSDTSAQIHYDTIVKAGDNVTKLPNITWKALDDGTNAGADIPLLSVTCGLGIGAQFAADHREEIRFFTDDNTGTVHTAASIERANFTAGGTYSTMKFLNGTNIGNGYVVPSGTFIGTAGGHIDLNTTAGAQELRVYYGGATNKAGIGTDTSTGGVRVFTGTSAPADRMFVDSSGNVIVGASKTSNGAGLLQVDGNIVPFTDATRTLGAASYRFTHIFQAPVTVASLGSASPAGQRRFASDANATTFASVVAGGGANVVPVYSDGTNWRIG